MIEFVLIISGNNIPAGTPAKGSVYGTRMTIHIQYMFPLTLRPNTVFKAWEFYLHFGLHSQAPRRSLFFDGMNIARPHDRGNSIKASPRCPVGDFTGQGTSKMKSNYGKRLINGQSSTRASRASARIWRVPGADFG